jgi:hypothetical protein
MKYCINITSGPLAGTLEDDDLRGEGRWERMVARGLINAGVQVGTPLQKWKGDAPNWIGAIEDLSDSVYITIYPGLVRLPRTARIYILQFFSPPDAAIHEEIRQIISFAGHRNVLITHSYPSDGAVNGLPEDLRDRTALLPVPVPPPIAGDATERTVLFHPSRHSFHSLFGDGGEILGFVRRALLRNSQLTFETVSGTYETNHAQLIREHPLFAAALGDLADRVTVHPPLGHREVQAIYARTRLVICPSGYGGPPIESARHGIPVVALERDCSLYSAPYTPGFAELPRLGAEQTLVAILDRLLYDSNYARRVGDAGRHYVAEHYGQAAFEAALKAITDKCV